MFLRQRERFLIFWVMCRTRTQRLATLSDETKTRILTGPGLDDFVSGRVNLVDAPATPNYLKRKKGQRLEAWVWLNSDVTLTCFVVKTWVTVMVEDRNTGRKELWCVEEDSSRFEPKYGMYIE